MNEFSHHYFDYGGLALHYVEAVDTDHGDKPLLLFYHGFPLFWFSFHHQLRALKTTFRCVAVDGLGVNRSAKPSDLDCYKLPELAQQLDALAHHLAGTQPFYLVGHDWGGGLALTFAQAYPARLNKVVSINAPPINQLLGLLENNTEQQQRSAYMYAMRDGDVHRRITENGARALWQQAYAGFRKLPHYTPEHDEIFRQGLAQPGAIDGAINWYRANIPPLGTISDEHYWPSRDAATDVPTLLIWGETDTTFVDSFIDDLPQFAHNLEVQRIPEIGHSPMLETPTVVNRLLETFLTH